MTTLIRCARPGDEAEITAMIYELATFERAEHDCTVTQTQMRAALFGPDPMVHALLAEVAGRVAAAAVWFLSFSTWDGRPGIYLEDLFVRPGFRRQGLARAL
ncbi:MAG: GNAT family N-acetyltransferase, partial [Mycobacteriaceae bacterium]|nr:GNAT family N-acetyltransferase [Mycobacteriaceae bacterium]